MVERVGYFNNVEVQTVLKAYNVKMDWRGVNKAIKLKYFCLVVDEMIYEEMKELQEAHISWGSFKEALRETYDYK